MRISLLTTDGSPVDFPAARAGEQAGGSGAVEPGWQRAAVREGHPEEAT